MSEKSIKILEIRGNSISLIIEGFSVAYVNSIRRLILTDVPTLAIDFAYFYDNSTDVYDEMIAHRLGLVILRSDIALEKYALPEICSQIEPPNPKCFVELFLDYSLGDDTKTGVYVKVRDLKISDPDVEPIYPDTPITYIAPGQRLHLVAYARLGRGREHAKWSPASISILKYTPIVYYDASKVTRECLDCIAGYPMLVNALESQARGRIEIYGMINTSGLRYCAESLCKDSIRVEYSPNILQLIVEGTGALKPERIIYEATRVLEDKIKSLRAQIDKLEADGK
ncbi:MAG: DNA-directed RNA polymerase subunit D [Acidilobaceae archaeon]